MKASIVCCILVFIAVAAETNGRGLYDEKSDAIQAIKNKEKEFNEAVQKANKDIEDEEKKIKPEEIENSKKKGQNKSKETMDALDKEIIKAIRSGIARGKTLSNIDCIFDVARDGSNSFKNAVSEHEKILDNTLVRKKYVICVSKEETKLIKTSLGELVIESTNRINNATSGIETLKKDGIKKCTTAINLLRDIIARLPELKLNNLIYDQDTAMAKKFDKMLETSIKAMQKCVA